MTVSLDDIEYEHSRDELELWELVTDISGSVQQRRQKIIELFDQYHGQPLGAWKVKRHILRRLTLDLVRASLPLGTVPPHLIQLLIRALDLPRDHSVSDWPLLVGAEDERGKTRRREERDYAQMLDFAFWEKQGKWMPLRQLERSLAEKLDRRVDRKSLRAWRNQEGYYRKFGGPPPVGGQ